MTQSVLPLEMIETFKGCYRSIDLRVVAVRENDAWHNAVTVLRLSHEDCETQQQKPSHRIYQLPIKGDKLIILRELLPFSSWQTVIQQYRSGSISLGEECSIKYETADNLNALHSSISRRSSSDLIALDDKDWPRISVGYGQFQAKRLTNKEIESDVGRLSATDIQTIITSTVGIDLARGISLSYDFFVDAPIPLDFGIPRLLREPNRLEFEVTIHKSLTDVVVSAEFTRRDVNSRPLGFSRPDLTYTVIQRASGVETRQYRAGFADEDLAPWIYVRAAYRSVELLEESHYTEGVWAPPDYESMPSLLSFSGHSESPFAVAPQSTNYVPSLRRWLDIASYAITSSLLITTISRPIDSYLEQFINHDFLKKESARGVAVFALSVVALTAILRMMSFRFRHLRNGHRYPPLIVSVVLSGVLYSALNWQFSKSIGVPQLGALAYAALALGPLLILTATKLRFPWLKKSPPSRATFSEVDSDKELNFDSFTKTPAQLLEWIFSEVPVTTAQEDLLSSSNLANRLTTLIQENKIRTIALVGSRGTGKSSTVNLVSERLLVLKGKQNWLHCNISCWGIEDSSAASEFILRKLIDTLEDHVDCQMLRGLPSSYVKSLSLGSGATSALATLLSNDSSPSAQLRRLNPILDSLNIHILVIIEDLDRTQSDSFDIRQLESTLNHLKFENPRISFVVCADPRSEMDFVRLADHIQILPDLNRRISSLTIKTVRRWCQSLYPDIPLEGDNSTLVLFDPRLDYEELRSSPERPSVEDTCLDLVATVRDLKHVLRRTITGWHRLHGEIDFNDLLVLNIIRHTAPDAFRFAIVNVDLMRGTVDYDEPARRRKFEIVHQKWDAFRATTSDTSWAPEAVWRLMAFLFPDVDDQGISRAYERTNLQCVRYSWPTDYFRRAVSEEVPATDLPDQQFLKQLDQWLKDGDESNELSKQLYGNHALAAKLKYFTDRVPKERLLDFASSLITSRLEQGPPHGPEDRPGLVAVFSCAAERQFDTTIANRWLIRELTRTLPHSLPLTNYVYSRGTVALKGFVNGEPSRVSVRKALYQAAQTIFTENDPLSLIRSIGSAPGSLYELVFPSDEYSRKLVSQAPAPSPLRSPSDWAWLTPVLIAASKHAKPRIALEICILLNIGKRSGSEYDLNDKVIDEMFPPYRIEMLGLAAEETDLSNLEPGARAAILEIQQKASQRLRNLQDASSTKNASKQL